MNEIATSSNPARMQATAAVPGEKLDVVLHRDVITGKGLELLNAGSFGEVYHYHLMETVYKVVIDPSGRDKLYEEFQLYSTVYRAIGNSLEAGGFWTPRPWDFYTPASSEAPAKVLKGEWLPPRPIATPRDRPTRSTSSVISFADFTRPTFVLDLVPVIHPELSDSYKQLFWTAELREKESSPLRMFRLYLGRTDPLPTTTSELAPGLRSDPPLDQARYTLLASHLAEIGVDVPSLSDVASGMGVVLSQLHWVAGINARDVELVLGGDGFAGFQCWILDYNQCQRWLKPDAVANVAKGSLSSDSITTGTYQEDDIIAGAKRLADLIFYAETYYPRPHQPHYINFKEAYLRTVEEICNTQALTIVESKQNDWQTFTSKMKEAAEEFFNRFEGKNEEKLARLRRRTGTTVGV